MSNLTREEILIRAKRRNIDLSVFKVERGAYFSNCNFFNLEGVDFSTCTLYRCYPKIGRGAIEILEIEDKAETNLANLKIKDLDFKEFDLEASDFSNSILVNVDFRESVLKSANFESAKLIDCTFSEANLENANFRYVEIPNSHGSFGNVWADPTNLKNVDFEGANIRNSVFIKLDLENANFENALASDCEFTEASMKGAKFDSATFEGAKFVKCDLHDSTWENAIIDNVVFEDSNLIGADLFGADLIEADFTLTGVKLINTLTDSKYLQKYGAIFLGPNSQFRNFDLEKRSHNYVEGANISGSTFSDSKMNAYFIDSLVENVVFKDYIPERPKSQWGALGTEFEVSFLRSNVQGTVFRNIKMHFGGHVYINAFNSDIRGMRIEDVESLRLHLEDCQTEGLVLRDLNIEACDFRNLKLKGVDFRGTQIKILSFHPNCSFEGALYNSKTKFPNNITDEQLRTMTFVEDED